MQGCLTKLRILFHCLLDGGQSKTFLYTVYLDIQKGQFGQVLLAGQLLKEVFLSQYHDLSIANIQRIRN